MLRDIVNNFFFELMCWKFLKERCTYIGVLLLLISLNTKLTWVKSFAWACLHEIGIFIIYKYIIQVYVCKFKLYHIHYYYIDSNFNLFSSNLIIICKTCVTKLQCVVVVDFNYLHTIKIISTCLGTWAFSD